MWRVIKAEFYYLFSSQKSALLLIYGLIPVFGILEIWKMSLRPGRYPIVDDIPMAYLVGMVIYFILLNWIANRNKELRIRIHSRLPLSLYQLALARIGVLLLVCLEVVAAYALFHLLFNPRGIVAPERFLVMTAAFLLLFSVYFLIRDLLLDYFRRIGFTKNRVMIAAVLLGLGFNVLGVLVLMQTTATGHSFLPVERVVGFMIENNPFRGEYGLQRFLVTALVLGVATVFSFRFRRSYLE